MENKIGPQIIEKDDSTMFVDTTTSSKRIDDSFIELFFDKNGRSKNNIYEKSTTKREEVRVNSIKKKKYSKKQLITAIVASIVLSASLTSALTTSVSNFIEQSEIDDTLDKALENYQDSIDFIVRNAAIRETLPTPNKAYGPVVNYDGSEIADQINNKYKTEKEQDIAVFTLYNSYGKAVDPACNGITNNTVKHLTIGDSDTCYKSFDDYLNKKGFESIDDYEERMREFITSEYKYNQTLDNVGGKQWK